MGILLVYDVTNLDSFDHLTYWLKNIQEVSFNALFNNSIILVNDNLMVQLITTGIFLSVFLIIIITILKCKLCYNYIQSYNIIYHICIERFAGCY